MVDDVMQGRMDVVIASLTMTLSREMGVEFMIPLGLETLALYIKTPNGEETTYNTFNAPFSNILWLTLFLFALLLAFMSEFFITLSNSSTIKKYYMNFCNRSAQVIASYFGVVIELNEPNWKIGQDFQKILFLYFLEGSFSLLLIIHH